MKNALISILFVSIFISSSAQLSGIVKDKSTGKPLEGVEVFINNSSWQTVSDKSGAFVLDNIFPGFFDLVLYKKGYQLFKSSMRVQEGKLYKLTLELEVQDKQPAVKVKRDAQWNTNYLWYLGGLLGNHEFAQLCKVENNPSLQFQIVDSKLHVTASDPITINNQALGIEMRVYLQKLVAANASSEINAYISYRQKISYEYAQQNAWERNRLKAYWGSSSHFFQSLISGNTSKEGYALLTEGAGSGFQNSVSAGSLPGYYKLSLPGTIKVKFNIEGDDSDIVNNMDQLSELTFQDGFQVSAYGIPFSNSLFSAKGAMEIFGLSRSLPINYLPTSTIENENLDWKNFSLLREKVYLQTDRDYYYPRETIWFKAYFGYSLPILRDTLSGVLYVDLISPSRERIDTRTYRIKEGVAWGEMQLDKALPEGEYYLRAYTNWMRNYGDSAICIKQIPVLPLDANIAQATLVPQEQTSSVLHVHTNQVSYKGREKVTLSLQMKDEQGKPVKGNLSISVTDAVVSAELNQPHITTPSLLTISDLGVDNKYFDQIKHYMERGLSFRGVVKDGKGVPTASKLDIIQGNLDNLISMETDDKGEFLVTGLHFTDSILFAFKPVNAKGKPLPRVDLIPNPIPEANFSLPTLKYELKKDNAIQRIQNVYTPGRDAILLKEVEVKSTRLASDVPKGQVRIYGAPDYVIDGENIRATNVGTNFLVGLQGKVPGLRVVESVGMGGFPIISVRVSRAGSFTSSTEPLILVDGVPFPDAQSISSLSASMVERVEVITRAAPQYGSRGSNGVIAIYTKQGSFFKETEPDYLSFKAPGYHTPGKFFSPDYSANLEEFKDPDFRTTIFWKPDLKADEKGEATVSFYTADLATRYRIVVEGISEKGTPVRSVTYITVE